MYGSFDPMPEDIEEPEQFALTRAQKQELDRRLAAHLACPDDVIPWEQVKSQTLGKARQ